MILVWIGTVLLAAFGLIALACCRLSGRRPTAEETYDLEENDDAS